MNSKQKNRIQGFVAFNTELFFLCIYILLMIVLTRSARSVVRSGAVSHRAVHQLYKHRRALQCGWITQIRQTHHGWKL